VRRHPALVAEPATGNVQRIVERLFLIEVVAFDWNCSQYITPRFAVAEIEEAIAQLRQKIAELEARFKAGS